MNYTRPRWVREIITQQYGGPGNLKHAYHERNIFHNRVPRLYRHVRPGAIYGRSLELLGQAKKLAPHMPVKTGMMLGLGEVRDEVLQAMGDLVAQGTDILTLGQYLQPTREHLPVVRFVEPREFAEYKQLGQDMGFRHVESGPLVRSSYHAFEQVQAAQQGV